MKALPDEEGIETSVMNDITDSLQCMKALPDEEGIETAIGGLFEVFQGMKALPDEEGIETWQTPTTWPSPV